MPDSLATSAESFWQWLWLSWQSGRFQFHWSVVRIQSSARLYNEHVNCNEKTKIKKKPRMAQFFKKINKIWHLRKVYFRYSFHVMKRSRKCHCCKMSLQALNMTRCLLNKTTFLRRFHSIQPGYWSRVPTIWPSSDNQSLNHIEAYSFSSKICV